MRFALLTDHATVQARSEFRQVSLSAACLLQSRWKSSKGYLSSIRLDAPGRTNRLPRQPQIKTVFSVPSCLHQMLNKPCPMQDLEASSSSARCELPGGPKPARPNQGPLLCGHVARCTSPTAPFAPSQCVVQSHHSAVVTVLPACLSGGSHEQPKRKAAR